MKKLENIPHRVEVPFGNGKYVFKLGALLHEADLSMLSLVNEIESEYKVIAKYVYGDLTTKLDMRVLAKICDFFQCSVIDIVEYVYGE